jgi:SAM-dependent methyltransferase
MDDTTIRKLNDINRAFYAATAGDFHATRGTAWRGWERLLPHLAYGISVLDVGCGNGRFGVFLADAQRLPLVYHGIDNSPALLAYARDALAGRDRVRATFDEIDLVESLLSSATPVLVPHTYDLVVLFGVMHHVPGSVLRLRLMRALAQCVKPGGLLAIACWRLYEQERFRQRIVPWDSLDTAASTVKLATAVEPGDYLLDWKRGTHALRYCHHVDDAEHDALVEASGLREIERYRADGETGDANVYSIATRAASPV